MRLLQDPVWAGHSSAATAPNVQPRPVWHPQRAIPFVVFCAVRHIAKGEELLVSYGEVRAPDLLSLLSPHRNPTRPLGVVACNRSGQFISPLALPLSPI